MEEHWIEMSPGIPPKRQQEEVECTEIHNQYSHEYAFNRHVNQSDEYCHTEGNTCGCGGGKR